jgi:SAM-dependent methyltransferase
MAADDVKARHELLEDWAAEQQKTQTGAARPSRPGLAGTRLAYRLATGYRRLANRILDRGLDTSDSRKEPEHDHPDRIGYVASDWHVLPRALRYIGVSNHDTFVDFGCGNGRILHQAAKRPFRRVIGVEISPALAEIARKNLQARSSRHRCGNVEVVVSDVAQYPVPDDLTIGYLFHPFKDETFDALLKGIIESIDRNPRRLTLIYNLPVQQSQVLATERFRLLTVQRNWFLGDPASGVAIFESV